MGVLTMKAVSVFIWFAMACCARFGWEFGGWVLRRLL